MPENTKDSKAYDYHRPIQRIGYGGYDDGDPGPAAEASRGNHVSGLGFSPNPNPGIGPSCVCHTNADAPYNWRQRLSMEVRRAMRGIPSWIPPFDDDHPNQEREVQGKLSRSFQTWTDVPALPYHLYYDWNFHLVPDKGFVYVRGEANKSADPKELAGLLPAIPGNNVECEWDCGTLGTRPGPMFYEHWRWPMTGDYVWCAGRLIYDCGHPTSDEKDPKKPNAGRARSELHPVKAMASAQWEAEKFPENGDFYVPAQKFLFFSSRHGGYTSFSTIRDKDYKFVVDLPRLYESDPMYAIGHTPRDRVNTIRLRPRLLVKFDFTPFAKPNDATRNAQLKRWFDVWDHGYQTYASATSATQGTLTPQVELVLPFDPTAPQAQITIPLSTMGSGDFYGVIVSLGWYDPDGVSSRRIKKCTVKFEKLNTAEVDHDTFAEEWFLKMAVNGRWFWFYSGEGQVHNNDEFTFEGMTHTFYLNDEDSIRISAHGAEINPVDDVFHYRNRQLAVNGNNVDYVRDIQNGTLALQHQIYGEFLAMQQWTFGDENQPLGFIEVEQKVSGFKVGGPAQHFRARAFHTTEIGHSAEPAYNKKEVDYYLTYSILVENA